MDYYGKVIVMAFRGVKERTRITNHTQVLNSSVASFYFVWWAFHEDGSGSKIRDGAIMH
jgi:hypothetical protein